MSFRIRLLPALLVSLATIGCGGGDLPTAPTAEELEKATATTPPAPTTAPATPSGTSKAGPAKTGVQPHGLD